MCVRIKYRTVWTLCLFCVFVAIFVSFRLAYQISLFNRYWLDVLNANQQSYLCTSDTLWLNVELLQSRYESSGTNQHVFGIEVICAFQVFLTVMQFCANYILVMKWYRENPKNNYHVARAIQVGLPPEFPTTIDRGTGLS